jgi:hypothetical protein
LHRGLPDPLPPVPRPRRPAHRQPGATGANRGAQAEERRREREQRQRERAVQRERREEHRERRRLEEAAAFCKKAIDEGAIDAAKERGAEYITDLTWARITRDWSGQNCDALARIAEALLNAPNVLRRRISALLNPVFDRLEEWLAKSAALRRLFELPLLRRVTQRMAARLARIVAQELFERLAVRIPLPSQKLTAVARAIQMTGIIVCYLGQRDLTTCACFTNPSVSK